MPGSKVKYMAKKMPQLDKCVMSHDLSPHSMQVLKNAWDSASWAHFQQ